MTLNYVEHDTFIKETMASVLNGNDISFEDAEKMLSSNDVYTLAECSNSITRTFNGDIVDVETLINAKSGACPEDCSFCAQSSFYSTGVNKYSLLPQEIILEQ